MDPKPQLTNRRVSRRSLLKGAAIGAGAVGAGLMSNSFAFAAWDDAHKPTKGDVAILRFLAAAELLESDLWSQYNELGGIQDSELLGGSGSAAYTKALQVLDADMPQYIHDNTEDEISHNKFINAYLVSKGIDPINLDKFRTLPSSKATGAQNIGRLTNLMQLTVDTSWWARYRSRTKNPDLGDTFPQAVPGLMNGQFPAIPRNDDDLDPPDHLQAIANTAAFHFATIETGGSCLLPQLAQRVTDPEVLRILLSIGPVETMQFATWSDKAGNAPPVTDPTNGLVFPDLNKPPFGGEDFQTNLFLPEPTVFLNRTLPAVSIIRPTETKGAAMAVVKFLVADGLFIGQSQEFFKAATDLAMQADEARRLGPG